MSLEVDASERFLTADRRRDLVAAVVQAEPEDEGRWIEWKSTLDLGTKDHKFKVAKSILGFANRTVDEAEPWAAGYGYLLVGVEPGNLVGIEPMDIAAVQSKLKPWVGGGRHAPRWSTDWVVIEGRYVLLIEVGPPLPSDPLFPLRQPHGTFYEGSIFVRRQASSDPADAGEILQLSERAAARRRIEVGVCVATGRSWGAFEVSGPEVETYLDRLRSRCLGPLEEARHKRHLEAEARRDRARKANPILGETMIDVVGAMKLPSCAALPGLDLGFGERRSEEAYELEVEQYLDECRTVLTDVLVSRLLTNEVLQISLRIDNPTERHLPAVRAKVTMLGPIYVWDPDRPFDLPGPPKPWGSSNDLDIPILAHLTMGPTPYVVDPNEPDEKQNPDGIEIRWQPVEVPPLETVDLPAVAIAVQAQPGVDSVPIVWRASSPEADGVASGSVDAQLHIVQLDADQIDGWIHRG